MDKKIPEKALEGLAPVPIHISQQTTPAGETYYKATVRHRDTIGIEKIINRIVAKQGKRIRNLHKKPKQIRSIFS